MTTLIGFPFPKSAYLRLAEHQSKLNLPGYHADIPLVLFIVIIFYFFFLYVISVVTGRTVSMDNF